MICTTGAEVITLGGCCGLAGNFGVEKGHYEVSVKVAEHDLLPALKAHPDAIVLADGFSCRTQLDQLASRDGIHLAQLLAAIPPEHVWLVSAAISDVGLDVVLSNPALVIALADHVSFALKRFHAGLELEYPLLAEVQHLYADEYRQATELLEAINARAGLPLPDQEAVGLALHLVNSGFSTGDLSYTYTMTGIIQQMIAVRMSGSDW